MSKMKRIRDILESNTRLLLPVEYDIALIGIYYKQQQMVPVYKYLALIEAHMDYYKDTEEQSFIYVEENLMTNPAFIIVDDTGV